MLHFQHERLFIFGWKSAQNWAWWEAETALLNFTEPENLRIATAEGSHRSGETSSEMPSIGSFDALKTRARGWRCPLGILTLSILLLKIAYITMSYVIKGELYGAMIVEMLPDIRIICFDQKHRYNDFNIAVEISLRGCKPWRQ
jgi:hypothetical protein